ncbi:MAG TPA: O-antigen ligase family protein [Gemmatimonadales bacterium]|nr:O-antigen ligase family protein [Gemmatimonadales bacterium]
MAVPLNISLGELNLVNAAAQSVAVLTIVLLLPAAIAGDFIVRRPGSAMRLLVLAFALSSAISWLAVTVQRGFAFGALLSVVNWVALGGLVILGQVLLADASRLRFALSCWVGVQAITAAAAVTYLLAVFGLDLFLADSRGPFQLAMQAILPNWPNGSGLVFATSACLAYGQLRGGERSPFLRLALVTLVIGTLVTFSRAAWLACFGGLVVITMVGTRLTRSLPTLVGLLIVTGLVASQVPTVRYQVQRTLTPGSSEQISVLQRVAFGIEAFRLWREHPVVGIGFARFTDYASLARLSAMGPARADYVPGSVHNEYLSILLKGGLLSAVTFLLFIWRTLRHHRRLASSKAPSLELRSSGIAGLGIVTALLVGGLGGESFRQVSISAPYWLLAGALSVLGRHSASRTSTV